MTISRRTLAGLALGGLALHLGAQAAHAEDKVIRIGYQKYGNAILLKAKGTLEPKLAAIGYKVTWSEFQFGPRILEAINAGAIDCGHTG